MELLENKKQFSVFQKGEGKSLKMLNPPDFGLDWDWLLKRKVQDRWRMFILSKFKRNLAKVGHDAQTSFPINEFISQGIAFSVQKFLLCEVCYIYSCHVYNLWWYSITGAASWCQRWDSEPQRTSLRTMVDRKNSPQSKFSDLNSPNTIRNI